MNLLVVFCTEFEQYWHVLVRLIMGIYALLCGVL